MNCREFENLLPLWIQGRLSGEQAQRLETHSANCPACREAAAQERDVQQRWQSLPAAPPLPDLWPRLAQRIEAPLPQQRRIGFSLQMAGSALFVFALAGSLFWMRPRPLPVAPRVVTGLAPMRIAEKARPIPELPVASMVQRMEQFSDEDGETFLMETQQDRQIQRRLLLKRGSAE